MIEFKITPVPKPRMTRADAWKKRPCVMRYWAFKDGLNLLAKQHGYTPGETLSLRFIVPMPKSWSKKKKVEMDGKPHQSKPDLDNLIKSVKDCLLDEDSHVWQYGKMEKV